VETSLFIAYDVALFAKADISITLIEVGCQSFERKKWLHCFEGVDAVIFVVAMSEYGQTVQLDNNDRTEGNRMQESLKIFGTICNSKWFVKSSILLFLNKKDVFYEKIPHYPINVCFPEYKEAGENYDAAANYIQQEFRNQQKKEKEQQTMFCHYTNAKDTENIKVMFDIIVDIIIKKGIQQIAVIC